MESTRRGFFGGLLAVTVVATIPVKWTADKIRLAFISVKNYGARGDGTTDDGPAIRAALADLKPGETLYFPTGTYLLDAPLIGIKYD